MAIVSPCPESRTAGDPDGGNSALPVNRSLIDDGPDIPQAAAERLFTPFFT